MNRDPIEDVEGRVQFERLAASLAHKADLHGGTGRLGALHCYAARGRVGGEKTQLDVHILVFENKSKPAQGAVVAVNFRQTLKNNTMAQILVCRTAA